MKKQLYLSLLALLAFAFPLHAQQFVSTEPSNRNVILEEFTGRNCGYCPDGHVIANQIMANNPGRAWAINVHGGAFSPTSYPNLNTSDGLTIQSGFSISGFPAGVANRSTASAQGRGAWMSLCNAQLAQPSELNVGGQVVINPVTRVATVTVEVYYTGNSTSDQNYLTVAMLQDSIMGSQSGGATNPSQWINGQYCHMHALRDIITPSTWGDAISPTTAGTLITKTYEYQIPESIGSPNGVAVNLNHIFFLAWVSEKFQGTPTRPILSACELAQMIGTENPIYPMISQVTMTNATSCVQQKNFSMRIENAGLQALTEIKFKAECEGATTEYTWTGNLASYSSSNINMAVNLPFGTHNVKFSIVEANGQPYDHSKTISATCGEWVNLDMQGDEEELKIHIMQDKFGNQTTWKVFASDMTVLASGGPYSTLIGGTATQLHVEKVVVPKNECINFVIYDSQGDGICCSNGNGYYKIFDSNNNLLVDGDGAFGEEASHLISTLQGTGELTVTTVEVRNITATSATFVGKVMGGTAEAVGFEYRKVTSPTVYTAAGVMNGNMFTADVNDLNPSTIYMVRAYAELNGEKIYGEDLTFTTTPDGVGEIYSQILIYPNPASDKLNVKGKSLTDVEVFNTMGQRVLSQQVSEDSVQLELDGLSNGVYFVRVRMENGAVVSHRFAVSK